MLVNVGEGSAITVTVGIAGALSTGAYVGVWQADRSALTPRARLPRRRSRLLRSCRLFAALAPCSDDIFYVASESFCLPNSVIELPSRYSATPLTAELADSARQWFPGHDNNVELCFGAGNSATRCVRRVSLTGTQSGFTRRAHASAAAPGLSELFIQSQPHAACTWISAISHSGKRMVYLQALANTRPYW